MRLRSTQGFTLIELMIVVAILGVLSAVAIPSFALYIKRSKTAEVGANLDSMFKSAASYYTSERGDRGQVSSVAGHCTVDDAHPSPAMPGASKQAFIADASFAGLGYSIGDMVYFSYGLVVRTGTGACDNASSQVEVYTFFANGDLDGDGIQSNFELAAGSSDSNALYHAAGLHISNETE
jgi:prepilin-type N-terminal cleavage/methylation domain-containing protein